MRLRGILVTSLVVGGLTVPAGSAVASVSAAAPTKTVSVKLFEFKIQPTADKVASGRVKFKVKNIGGVTHEMVLVRSNATPLPTLAGGSVNEDAIAEANKFGEVSERKPKKSGTLLVKELPPGTYVMFCNIVDKESNGSTLSHYQQGMWTNFTVS